MCSLAGGTGSALRYRVLTFPYSYCNQKKFEPDGHFLTARPDEVVPVVGVRVLASNVFCRQESSFPWKKR